MLFTWKRKGIENSCVKERGDKVGMGTMRIDSGSEKLLARCDGEVGVITFNNPEKHNAMSMDMWQALAKALGAMAEIDSLRLVVLEGAGDKAFVSGADISEFETLRSGKAQQIAYEDAFDEAQHALAGFEKPVIARIKGYCVGGGLALALNADIRLASADSVFAIPAAKLGVGYGYESIKTLTSVVGPSFAKDILFSARFLMADEALRIGLVNQVVARDELDALVEDYVGRLVHNAPLTIRSVKSAVREIVRDPGQTAPECVEKLVEACFASDDYREGRKAFMEKRKPNFRGS